MERIWENGCHTDWKIQLYAFSSSHPDFSEIFLKTLEINRLEKDHRKAGETPRGVRMHHNAVEKQEKNPLPENTELRANSPCRNGLRQTKTLKIYIIFISG